MSGENSEMQSRTQTRAWRIFQRQQEISAELRFAFIRIAAIVAFYLIHLYNYFSSDQITESHAEFHWKLTLVCGVWFLVSVSVFFSIWRKHMPPWSKYLTTGADILLLVAAAVLNAGANSFEVMIFPVIVASAALRFNRSLICFATVASIAGYLTLVGATDHSWFDPNHAVPTVHLLITITCITLAGVIGWQIVDQVRKTFLPASQVPQADEP